MKKNFLINNQIRAEKIRVIDEQGNNLGVMPLAEALKIAQEKEKDLIQITEKGDYPVCKIENYGKFLYQLKKKEKQVQTKSKKGQIKILRLSFNISMHDLETKANQTEKFLNQGFDVQVEMRLKGREKMFKNLAKDKIGVFLKILSEKIKVKISQPLKEEAFGFSLILKKDEG